MASTKLEHKCPRCKSELMICSVVETGYVLQCKSCSEMFSWDCAIEVPEFTASLNIQHGIASQTAPSGEYGKVKSPSGEYNKT